MANKKTIALTEEQYFEIIDTIENGFLEHRPNHKIATALKLEANLGLRIQDTLSLKLNDIVLDGGRYRLNIIEQKTKKERTFTVPIEIVEFLTKYCKENNITPDEYIFPLTVQAVNKHLRFVADFLGYENISTHAFRKYFATSIYKDNDYNIALVQKLLQHSSPAITQRYIGISTKEVENALNKHIKL